MGTEGSDVVTVDFVEGRPATVEINGETFTNPDDSMHLDLQWIDPNNPEGDQLFLRGADFEIDISNNAGTALAKNTSGMNLTFDFGGDAWTLTTGDGNDTVEEDGTYKNGSFGNTINTGGGFDWFIYNGGGSNPENSVGAYFLDLGEGDDTFIYQSRDGGEEFNLRPNGGEGNDNWRSRLTDGVNIVASYYSPGISDEPFYGFEFIYASDSTLNVPSEGEINRLSLSNRDSAQLIVQGNLATVLVDEWETPIRFFGFNSFDGKDGASTSGIAYVLDEFITFGGSSVPVPTDYPVSFSHMDAVNVGGGFTDGSMTGIEHEISISDTDVVILTNSGSSESMAVTIENTPGSDGLSSVNRVSGMSPADILLSNINHTNLSASATADDIFYVHSFDSHLLMFGHGGDDGFSVGAAGDLALAGQSVAAIGGAGNDYLIADAKESVTITDLRLHENWIYDADPESGFEGIYFDETEDVVLELSLQNRVFVTPSEEAQFLIRAGFFAVHNDAHLEAFILWSPPGSEGNLSDNGDSTFTWWWNDQYRSIFLYPNN